MLEEILKKESITDEDVRIIMDNIHDVSDADKIRLGLMQDTTVLAEPLPEQTEEESATKELTRRRRIASVAN